MEVLVIGGSGFIGSHVVDHLKKDGHNVRIATRNIMNKLLNPFEETKDVLYVPRWVDVETELETEAADLCFAALDGIDVVIHLGSSTIPSTSNQDPLADINDNLISTVNILKLIRIKGIKKFIYMSSGGAIYDNSMHNGSVEDDQLSPRSSYGIIKIAIENYIFIEVKLHGLSATILRPSNPYGPGQMDGSQGIIGKFLWNIANDKSCEIWGDGNIIRDFIYVEDVARACVYAVKNSNFYGRTSGIYNISSGVGYRINDLLPIIGKIVGKPVSFSYHEGRNFDIKRVVLDNNKAYKYLSWSPNVSLEDGIKKTWEWIQEYNK
jgi:UDP-glucose 4-epimerase